MNPSKLFALAATSLLLAAGCAAEDEPSAPTTADEADLKDVEKTGGRSQKWIYQGALPKLEQAAIVASLKGHTARVTGLLPASFTGELPFYARPTEEADGRTRVTIVYPIATGAVDPSTGKAPAGPGHYSKLWAVPFTPTNEKASWGGFPFMKYHNSRGLAFHGPITSTRNADTGDWEWTLKRGPVSHGCQRMQGEHVVELAHVIGMEMSRPRNTESVQITVSVDIISDWDTFEGQSVDVDYPSLASVQRPTSNAIRFPTWDSRNLPQIVCAYDSTRPVDGHHCDDVGEIKQDVLTGEMLVSESADAWIGTECEADDDCGFEVDGEGARCLVGGGGKGYCTVSCQGFCDDAPGHAGTFCGRTQSGGTCMAKAAPENGGCADVPGTQPKQVERFIGTSTATAKVATVCSF